MTESGQPPEAAGGDTATTPSARPVQLGEVATGGAVEPLSINLAPLMEVPLKVSVMLGETRMSLGDLLRLGAGSVIELARGAGEPIDVLVNDRLYAKGEIVAVGEDFGVRVVELVAAAKVPAGEAR